MRLDGASLRPLILSLAPLLGTALSLAGMILGARLCFKAALELSLRLRGLRRHRRLGPCLRRRDRRGLNRHLIVDGFRGDDRGFFSTTAASAMAPAGVGSRRVFWHEVRSERSFKGSRQPSGW